MNEKLTAKQALDYGLVNKVVPDDKLVEATREMALHVADRGAFALASLKAAFSARHSGVGGLARMSHDLLLSGYLNTDESKELGASRSEKSSVGKACVITCRPSRTTHH